MEINYIPRNHNVITLENTLEKLHTFSGFPVYIGCVDEDRKQDILADLSIAICKKTGIIQLDKVLPLDIVYSKYHSEALGGLWNEHHLSFVDFVNKYKPFDVLEIGGSNGFIAKEAIKKNKEISNWIIVEPNPAYDGDEKIKVIPKSFDQDFIYPGKVDCIIHSHTFEHIYEPALFMKHIGEFMDKNTYQIFSVPNLQKYLFNKQANWINFEHTVYLSEHYIDYLLILNGYEILEKKYFYEHSIFYATRKISHGYSDAKIINKYDENKKLFYDFLMYYQNLINEYNFKISSYQGDVYLFGAHIFSQFFMLMGLDNRVKGVLDNSTLKEGKRLYGTDLKVYKPDVINNKNNVMVILKVGSYQDEVRNQLLNINNKVIILE